jgi:hypothetical protein
MPREDTAIAFRVGKPQAPPVFADPLQVIGPEWHGQPSAPENSSNCPIKAIGHDGDVMPSFRAKAYEVMETGVDLDLVDEGVELFLARTDQIDLTHHAFAGPDATRPPLLLYVPPSRISEPLEN